MARAGGGSGGQAAEPPPRREVACDILVVDDEPIILDFLEQALARLGAHVVRALDAEGALALLAQRPFDVVIADKNLPRLSGLELVRRAKAADPTIAALLITGYPSTESAEEALSLGVDDYLFKPFDIPDLLRKVDEAVGRRATRREGPPPTVAPRAVHRVMVCEPDERDRELLSQAVALLGHVAETATVAEVLAAIREGRAEAVICSLAVLEREDAHTCFLRSRLILSPDIRFVAVASHRQPEDVVEAIRIGAGKVVFRPLDDPVEVAELLRPYLGATGAAGT